ncbi:unnamed protein product [Zymoseptoria tritici ST99CH_1A5]|uniref:Uncharacterized protein n=3 Tax=Zymoseptoria tritici TaxID=1047171 RepID=A0A1X7RZN8_ZYMT9|nr:unnamed protein product [Zymoseptoria tritici ST99CH_3D7]SMR55492.1 unnamed protein product [Zymoseptoria tritici ST99CH_1E4]SMR57866.1 unnamed protein product [Zymoseptoria tritici ST99CH_3D1]SMY26302.1 unnamed protein product [Zymoseptoria tritici ST99CH_1A5]
MVQTRQISYEDDEEMLQLLEKKRKQEEAELFNAPETMARKRKAVREAAKFTLAPKSSTDLDFDDDVELAGLEASRGPAGEGPDGLKLEQQESPIASLASQVGAEEAAVMEDKGEVKREDAQVKREDAQVKREDAQVKRESNDADDGRAAKVKATRARAKKRRRSRERAKRAEREEKKKPLPRVVTLPIVRLDPEIFANKSKTSQRRSRQRIRRMEKEQEELLSSQLQVV